MPERLAELPKPSGVGCQAQQEFPYVGPGGELHLAACCANMDGCAHLNMACAVVPHAGSNAILLVGVRRPQDWRMHLIVWQVCHCLPCCRICIWAI